jgi:hypothetical protein
MPLASRNSLAVGCLLAALTPGCKSAPPVQNEQLRLERVTQPNPGFKVGRDRVTYTYRAVNGTAPLTWEFRDDWSTWALTPDGLNAALVGEPLVGFAAAPPVITVTVTDAHGATAKIEETIKATSRPNVTARVSNRRWQGTAWLFEVKLDSAFSADSRRVNRHVLQVNVDTEGLIKGDRVQILDGVNDDSPSEWNDIEPLRNAASTAFGVSDGGEWFKHDGSGASRVLSTTVASRTFWIKVQLKDGVERPMLDPKITCVVH